MEQAIMVAAALIGAGICMGLAAIGAGLGDGLVTSKFIDGIDYALCKSAYRLSNFPINLERGNLL